MVGQLMFVDSYLMLHFFLFRQISILDSSVRMGSVNMEYRTLWNWFRLTALDRVDPERSASEFDAVYYGGLLDNAWGEEAFVFVQMMTN